MVEPVDVGLGEVLDAVGLGDVGVLLGLGEVLLGDGLAVAWGCTWSTTWKPFGSVVP